MTENAVGAANSFLKGHEVPSLGLTPQEYEELNGYTPQSGEAAERRIARLEELRSKYKNNSFALQQLDVFDNRTDYHVKLRELRAAMLSQNTEKETELGMWFEEHYPDIK